MLQTKIIVLDDDPTGSQTVHSCLLLTRWDVTTLKQGLLDQAPLFFVLTNTRAMAAGQAAEVTREVCRNLRQAMTELANAGKRFTPIVVSRSDSTLRGHYPVETDVIAAELGPFDAHFLVPAFFEGGRITRDSTHYLLQDGKAIPVHETEFARDAVFGYRHSYLPDYVAEKTGGRIPAASVQRFGLDEVRSEPLARLMGLQGNACCVVDAEQQEDLDLFCNALRSAAKTGKRFLFRSGASLLTSLAQLPPQPIAASDMHQWARSHAGLILVGSHVRKTTEQVESLLRIAGTVAVEVDVDRIAGERSALLQELRQRIATLHANGETPVVLTSREERQFPSQTERLAFGTMVSEFLMDIVRGLPEDIGFLISKGGITSNDVLSSGLALRSARVLGQILPGCSMVQCPSDHPRHPGMPVVIFPGNVGDRDALGLAYTRLSGEGLPKLERPAVQTAIPG